MERLISPTESPDVSILVCLHGDEKCPKKGIEKMFENSLEQLPVQVIVGNPEAMTRDVRSVEEDLNRCFPGDYDGATYEKQLAAEIYEAVKGTIVLDLHTTTATAEPFIVLGKITSTAKRLARESGLNIAVDQSTYASGGLVQYVDGISIECGLKQSQKAAHTAQRITRRILQYEGYIDGNPAVERSDPTVYEVYDEIKRPAEEDIDIIADNFTQVNSGDELYQAATEPVVATEQFCPVFLSADGYSDHLGFKAVDQGPISAYNQIQN